MTPLLAFAVIALSLGIVVAIASLLGAATRRLSPMLRRRRGTAQPEAPPRRVIRRSRRQSATLRRARRY